MRYFKQILVLYGYSIYTNANNQHQQMTQYLDIIYQYHMKFVLEGFCHQKKKNNKKHEVMREPNLHEAEATMTVFQVEFLRFEVTESPAQSSRSRLGLMLRQRLRHVVDSLQHAGTSERPAALTAAPPVPVFIHFVLRVDTVAGHWHRLS